jgi:phage terminase small subunit
VQEYFKDPNGKRAAIAAGYSQHTAESIGSRLLRNVKVRAVLGRLQSERADETAMDAKWVLERIKRVIDDAMGSDPMNGMVALKGLELVGKHNAMFLDNSGNSNASGLRIVLELGGPEPEPKPAIELQQPRR